VSLSFSLSLSLSLSLNSIEGDSVTALVNLTINVIAEYLDDVAPRRKVILRDRWQGKQWFSDAIR